MAKAMSTCARLMLIPTPAACSGLEAGTSLITGLQWLRPHLTGKATHMQGVFEACSLLQQKP